MHFGFFGTEFHGSIKDWRSQLLSFSYPTALALSMISIYLIILRSKLANKIICGLLDLLIIYLIIISGLAKISNCLVLLPVYFSFCFFNPGYSRLWLSVKFLIALMAFLLHNYSSTSAGQSLGIEYFHFYKYYYWDRYFLLSIFNYLYPFVGLIYLLIKEKYADGKLIQFLTPLLLLFALGIAPGLIFKIPGGSAGYFSDFSRSIALTLFLIMLYETCERFFLKKNAWYKYIAAFVFINFFFIYTSEIIAMAKKTLNPKVELCGLSYSGKGYANLLDKVKHNETSKIINELFKLSHLPKSIKQVSCLYFDSDNNYSLDSLSRNQAWLSSLIPQAITGIAALDLRPSHSNPLTTKSKDEQIAIGYGINLYGFRCGAKDYLTLSQAVAKAKSLDLTYVIYFTKQNSFKFINVKGDKSFVIRQKQFINPRYSLPDNLYSSAQYSLG
jgi:hypothetical protein